MSQRKTTYFPFKGGENHSTPALSITPGEVIASLNYEPDPGGGYHRVDGFERFDGGPLPSDAVYHNVPFSDGEHLPNLNETVVGTVSAAQGAIVDIVVESGSFAGGDAVGYFIVFMITGLFIAGETVSVYSVVAHSELAHSQGHN